jgi:hypothetical protein
MIVHGDISSTYSTVPHALTVQSAPRSLIDDNKKYTVVCVAQPESLNEGSVRLM